MAKYIVVHGIKIATEFQPETFGRLTTIGPRFTLARNNDAGRRDVYQVCRCNCGNYTVCMRGNLQSSHSKSCGCLRQEAIASRTTRHGMYRSLEFTSWVAMKSRCYNENTKEYARYGGRGIRVCDRWQEPNGQGFLNFLADIGPRPSPTHSIDRYPDPDGNYEPGNCRWATYVEQNRNKRSSTNISGFGKIKCLAAWAEEYSMPRATLQTRLSKGMTLEEAIRHPKGSHHKKSKNDLQTTKSK